MVGQTKLFIESPKKRGLVKITNFNKNPKKLNYIYILTPKGISEKTKHHKFYEKKMMEYDELKKEWMNNADNDKKMNLTCILNYCVYKRSSLFTILNSTHKKICIKI